MPVADVMTSRLVTVNPDEPAAAAVRRMVDAGVGSVLVCEGTHLQGIFTERDVLRLVAEGAPLEAMPVETVMTSHVFTVGPDDDIADVAHLMAERRIRHAPVAVAGNVMGMIGIRDVMRVLLERAYERHDPSARDTARDLLRPSSLSSVSPGGA